MRKIIIFYNLDIQTFGFGIYCLNIIERKKK